jgi:hypothetical protein
VGALERSVKYCTLIIMNSRVFSKLALLSAILLFGASNVQAHLDKEIFLNDGDLVGLPDAYNPAHFDKEKYVLTVGDQSFKFPDFLIEILKSQAKESKIRMFAAWWHEGDPYLNMEFMTEKNGGYICFFSLDDLSKLSVSKEIPVKGGYKREPLEFTEAQRKAISSGILQARKLTEQAAPGQPATAPESKSAGSDKPQPESKGRSR